MIAELLAHVALLGSHRRRVVVGGLHWRYCGHQPGRCWQWAVYDGRCARHGQGSGQ